MSDYAKSTNFTAKDTSHAVVLGAEHDAEYDAIAVAIATKANKVTGATSGNLASLSATGDLQDSGVAATQISTNATDITTLESKVPVWATVSDPVTESSVAEATQDVTGTVEEVTILFDHINVSGSSPIRLRLGTGSTPQTSGYAGVLDADGVHLTSTDSFELSHSASTAANVGQGVLHLIHLGSNQWQVEGIVHYTSSPYLGIISGTVTLSDALDVVSLSVASGTLSNTWQVNTIRSA